MDAKGWHMLHALINKFHQGTPDDLARHLPDDEKQTVAEHRHTDADIAAVTTTADQLLQTVHYSWLKRYMDRLSPGLRDLVLSSLPEVQGVGLANVLNVPTPSIPLSPAVRHFLLTLFQRHWASDIQVIPKEASPSKLSAILDLEKHQLVELIDLLGIWDLSEDVRRVIDKNRLQQIFRCLSATQQTFLQRCLQEHDRLTPPPLGIDRWDGNCQELLHLIHRRGLARFGKALSGQPEAIVRQVRRTLDTGRARILSGHTTREESQGVGAAAMQVLNALVFLNTEWRKHAPPDDPSMS